MKRNVGGPPKRTIRPGGSNRPGPPTDLIALGSKSKTELQRSAPEPVLKKSQTFHVASSSHQSRLSPTIPEPAVNYIDVPPQDLIKRVTEAHHNSETVDGIVCGAIKLLRANRVKPDHVVVYSLMVLAKKQPAIFRSEIVVECLVGLLKKDIGLEYIKSKGNSTSAVLACNLLMSAFEQIYNWPSLLVKVFVEDSLGDRIWVDHSQCHNFVSGISTAFDTVPIPKDQKSDSSDDNDKKEKEDSDEEKSSPKRFMVSAELVRLYAIDMVRERVGRRQGTISAQDPTGAASGRNLLKTLTAMCGISEVRVMAAHKLEMWLQNPKLMKATQDLLLSICVNCRDHNQDDVDVIGCLVKMRLKSKALLNHYIQCLKALIDAHKDSINTLFNYVVYNELSSARNPTNMSVIAALLQHKPKIAAETLAAVCQDLLLQQEDYLRAVRALIREIVRIARHDVLFPSFALGVMKEPDSEKFSKLDQTHKERYISAIADLICLIMLVSISPAVKEAIAVLTKKHSSTSEVNHESVYLNHKLDLAAIQRDAIWFFHATVIPLLLPKMTTQDFRQHIQKVLFLKPAENYYMKDNWPPEAERAMMVKHCSEVPILEDTMMRLSVIGLSHEHPLAPAETLDLIGQLVRRAGALGYSDFNPIPVERTDIVDTLLSLSQYHHPENIKLPTEYVPPSLAISLLYWTVWQTLLIISSFNPGSVGLQAWHEYPTLRSFMEMAIINNFTFPLSTVTDDNERSQIVNKEMQMVEMEKNEIIEFESHLAAASTHLAVTEETSLLLSQLIAMDTKGHPRRPPDNVLAHARVTCSQIQVGANLCRSRNPDFLLDIINRHGEDQAMPWLSGLVSSAKGDMSMLPVQCLCEFLMSGGSDDGKVASQEKEIVTQLQSSLHSDQADESMQAIGYFLRRLHSPQYETRTRAKHALSRILTNNEENMDIDDHKTVSAQYSSTNYDWLLQNLISLQNYNLIHSKAVEAVTEAIMWDSDEIALAAYVTFLANDIGSLDPNSDDAIQCTSRYALSVAHLLIDRPVLVKNVINSRSVINITDEHSETVGFVFLHSLLKIMLSHLNIARKYSVNEANPEETLEDIPWRDTQDEIFLRWPVGGGHAQLHILVSQAMILLLTYRFPRREIDEEKNESDKLYLDMLQTWFSENGATVPKAYLMDTQEEALLLPDWLRLRLLHCEVNDLNSRLPIAGSKDLEVEQLLLFIQSFGIPYYSMEHLLGALDEYCTSSSDLVLGLVKDNRSYLAKLVEGQWRRGCCNGTDFHALLSMDKMSPRPSVIHTLSNTVSEVVDLTMEQGEDNEVIMISSQETSSQEDVAEDISMQIDDNITSMQRELFMSSSFEGRRVRSKNKVFRNMLRMLSNDKSDSVAECITEMYTMVSDKRTSIEFIKGLYANTLWSSSLFRVIDSCLRKRKRNSNENVEESNQLFKKIITVVCTKSQASVSKSNALHLLLHSWTSSQSQTQSENVALGQLDWARLEEFLRKQLAFLGRDEEIKNKVALVAKILLEEIGKRKTKASRGKCDVQDDSFYASIGTTGLLIDWLQLLDPELLAHRPKLQRKLLFESQRLLSTSMPIKMSAKMSNLKLPQSFTSHQTYLLTLLTEHSNWETIYKCLQWLLSDSICEPPVEKSGKSSASSINVDARTAMDFLWVCMHMSNIWKGRENKSASLQEPVFYLSSKQFCHVLNYMVSSSNRQANIVSSKTAWGEASYFELFLIFYTSFGQKQMKSDNLENTVRYIHTKATETDVNLWWQLLSQLYILEPFHEVWNSPLSHQNELQYHNSTLAKIVTSAEVSSICRMDALVQTLIDRIGYVKESGNVEVRDSITAIQSNVDTAYDASLLLKKFASSRPAIVLRQLSLMLVTLSGRTWYEFREFKAKNHLLFMSQLIGILEAIGTQLFNEEYAEDVDKIFFTYFQMISNYCNKARRQMRDAMYGALRLAFTFLQIKPSRAHRIVCQFMYVLQGLMNNVYSDHEYIVILIRKIMSSVESASFLPPPSSGKNEVAEDGDNLIIDNEMSDAQEQAAPYLKMLTKSNDLENIAQVLGDLSDTKRRVLNLEPFLPHLTKHFTTCRESSIRHSALNLAVVCLRASPSRVYSKVLPAYLSCLTGDRTSLNFEGQQDDSGSGLSPDQVTTEVDKDEIARTAIDLLPDVVVLCREEATKILQAAFDCGSKNGVGIQSPGTQGILGTPLAVGGNSTWKDLSEVLAKSLNLLSGLSQPSISTSGAS